MAYVKLENNVVVQKQPYQEEGFVEAPDTVVCGQIKDGDQYINPPATVHQAKAKKQAALDALYNKKIAAGFNFQGNTFQIDQGSILNMTVVMTGFAIGGSNAHGGAWRSSNNTMVVMNDETVQAFILAAKSYVMSLYQVSWLHADNLAALNTAQDVEAYDITLNWPAA